MENKVRHLNLPAKSCTTADAIAVPSYVAVPRPSKTKLRQLVDQPQKTKSNSAKNVKAGHYHKSSFFSPSSFSRIFGVIEARNSAKFAPLKPHISCRETFFPFGNSKF